MDEKPTPILDISYQCLESFDRIVEVHDDALLTRTIVLRDLATGRVKRPRDFCTFFALRNGFLKWAENTRALSFTDSSLDDKFRGLPDMSRWVTESLESILRDLGRIDRKPEGTSFSRIDETAAIVSEAQRTFLERWDHATEAASGSLESLHTIAGLMRNTPAEHLEYSLSTIMTDDFVSFRKDMASLVRQRFPAARKALCQQLEDSIGARRELLLTKHHYLIQSAANRRYKATSVANDDKDDDLEPKRPVDLNNKERRVSHPPVVAGWTLDPEAQVTARRHTSMSPAIPRALSSNSIPQNDSFEYPALPKASRSTTRLQCPFCFVELQLKGSQEEDLEQWKSHIDQDIKPYSCIFPQCLKSLHFFVHVHEWEAHMESVHSKDWMQRVHTETWFCDIDHDTPLAFESECEWREHFFISASHPSLKKLPTKYQLDAYCTEIEKYVPRGEFVCPLCERIPHEILPETVKERLDASHIHSLLASHVANHIKSLALMDVPSIEARARDVDVDKKSISISRDSVADPPTGRESIEKAPLHPER